MDLDLTSLLLLVPAPFVLGDIGLLSSLIKNKYKYFRSELYPYKNRIPPLWSIININIIILYQIFQSAC